MLHHYTVAGLHVTSDHLLPGLIEQPDTPALVDVTITRAPLPPALERPINPLAELIVEIPGLMRMAMRQGRELVYDPAAGASAGDLALYLGGTGLGALLHQRGRAVLHASAVRMGDEAVLFCGASGAGKSTIAAALVNAGHGHVADDFCVIDFDPDGIPMVAPDGRRHKLWQSAIDGLAINDRRGGLVKSDFEKFFVDPRQIVTTPIRSGAIYSLVFADQMSIIPASPFEIVSIVQINAYRPQLVALMQQQQLYFDAAIGLARHTPIRWLKRPFAFATTNDLIAALELSL